MSTQLHTNTADFMPPPPLREYRADGGLKLNLHEGQLEAWDSVARFIAIISGTQAGKTSFVPHWLLREIKHCGSGDYLYATPTFTLLAKKALPEFREVFEYRSKLGRWHPGDNKFEFSEAGMRYIHGENREGELDKYDPDRPTTVWFGHASNSESLESATYKAAVLDEAGQETFKLESWEAIQRRLSLHQGRVLIATTPYNLGWLKREIYDRWVAGDTDYQVVNFASVMNPMFPKAEDERARRTLPKWKYEMFYRGKFSRPAGLIYDCFDEQNEIRPFAIPKHWHRVIGFDFGGRNTAAVKYALHPVKPIAYQYAEYYPVAQELNFQPRTAAVHACHIMKGEPSVHINWKTSAAQPVPTMTYDKNLFTVIGGSLSESQWRIEMMSSGLDVSPTFVRDVELGIERVYGQFQQRWLRVFKTMRYTLDEIGSYSRDVDEEGEPIAGTIINKEKYHLLDAKRYAISYIADPNRSAAWTTSDIAMINPDTDRDLMQLLDDDVNLDSPAAQRLINRRNALQHKSHKSRVEERESGY